MRRRRWLALVAGAAALVLTPVMAGAAPLNAGQIYKPVGFFRFCAEAQITVANMDEAVMAQPGKGITVGGTIYDDFQGPGDQTSDFVKSKSAVDIANKRVMTTQAVLYRDAARTKPKTILCKLRTGESLNKGAWPVGTPNNGGRFSVDPYFGFGSLADGVSTNATDQSCQVVNQQTVDTVWQDLIDHGQTPVYPKPTTVAGVGPTFVGPTWLNSQIPPISVNGSNQLEVRSNDLVTPSGYANQGNWEGAHYCTFVAPQYLHDVLLGDPVVS